MTSTIPMVSKAEMLVSANSSQNAPIADNTGQADFAETLRSAKLAQQPEETSNDVDNKQIPDSDTEDQAQVSKEAEKEKTAQPSINAQYAVASLTLPAVDKSAINAAEISTEITIDPLMQAEANSTTATSLNKPVMTGDVPDLKNAINQNQPVQGADVLATGIESEIGQKNQSAQTDVAVAGNENATGAQPVEVSNAAANVQKTETDSGKVQAGNENAAVNADVNQQASTAVTTDNGANDTQSHDNGKANVRQFVETKSANQGQSTDSATIDPLLSLSEQTANAVRVKQSAGIDSETIANEQQGVSIDTSEPAKVDEKSINQTATLSDLQANRNAKISEKLTSVQQTDIPKRIIDQVVREATLTKNLGKSDLVIKLTPPSMGTIRLQITHDSTGITTRIVTSSEDVKNLLNQHMRTLMTSMNEAGVKIESMTVTTDNKFESGMFSDFNGFKQAQNQSQNFRQNRNQYQQYSGIAAEIPTPAASRASVNTAYSWIA